MKRYLMIGLAALTLSGCTVVVETGDRCAFTADHSAAVELSGAKAVRIDAGSGALKVQGKADATEVSAEGKACASTATQLEQIRLTVEKVGDEIVVTAQTPAFIGFTGGSASLDLAVELPESLPVRVKDGSGDLQIRQVAGLELDDESGNAEISGINGDVRAVDDSGDLNISAVKGSVTLRDDSGNITVRDVGGSVLVEDDGSGDIRVDGVSGDVVVDRDGSGSIDARNVGGDLSVGDDGSGDITSHNVGGKTRVPSK